MIPGKENLNRGIDNPDIFAYNKNVRNGFSCSAQYRLVKCYINRLVVAVQGGYFFISLMTSMRSTRIIMVEIISVMRSPPF